jgi:hypothetical protein
LKYANNSVKIIHKIEMKKNITANTIA